MAGAAAEPQEIEVMVRLARSGPLGSRLIAALVRRILELQDQASEEELLAMVAQVEALLRPEDDGAPR
jgi:hypothetical protein